MPRDERVDADDPKPFIWRYEVCGHTNGCADRLMARLSQGSTTTTSTTNDSVKVFVVSQVRRWP